MYNHVEIGGTFNRLHSGLKMLTKTGILSVKIRQQKFCLIIQYFTQRLLSSPTPIKVKKTFQLTYYVWKGQLSTLNQNAFWISQNEFLLFLCCLKLFPNYHKRIPYLRTAFLFALFIIAFCRRVLTFFQATYLHKNCVFEDYQRIQNRIKTQNPPRMPCWRTVSTIPEHLFSFPW